MAEADSGPQTAPDGTDDGSRGSSGRLADFLREFRTATGSAGGISTAILIAGALGGLLMVVSEFMTIFSVDVVTATCEDLAEPDLADTCVTKGGEQHSYALVLLGLAAILMAYGAGLGGSRPAGGALLVIGVVVLAVAIFGDLPDADKTGAVGQNFSEAESNAGIGLWLELAGGALATLAGAFRLTRPAD